MSENKVKPLNPSKIDATLDNQIPDEMIEVINELIIKNWSRSSKSATIKLSEIVNSFTKKTDIPSKEVFDNKWLDIEDIFGNEGWIVKYDRPAYNEDYPPTFNFRAK